MKSNVYCVYDSVAEVAAPPFLQPNDSAARRAFSKLIRDSNMCGSADYRLIRVGFWEADNAILCGADIPESIMSSAEVLPAQNDTLELFAEAKND